MALKWDEQRENLKQLYLINNEPLKQVMEKMETLHGFIASYFSRCTPSLLHADGCYRKNQYTVQFKKWDWRKNFNESEWKYVGRQIAKRKEMGRES